MSVWSEHAARMREETVTELYDIRQARAEIEQLRGELTDCQRERDRLNHRCNVLGYLMYGHYLVQRTRESVQADIEACESALTALRRELSSLPQT